MAKEKDEIKEQEPKLIVENLDETAEQAPQENAETEAQQQAEEISSFKEVIREQATEEDAPAAKNFTLSKILGGDILSTPLIRNQVWVVLLIVGFLLIYISCRYRCQQYLIEIDKLKRELQDAKYKALSSSSQLTEKCRESHVLDVIRNTQDSILQPGNQPPFIINIEK